MEFLIRKNLTLLLFFILSGGLMAQSQADLQNAFSKSYTYENNKKYTEAIEAINAVYSESSYEINIRLGWLYYLDKKYDKSIGYYQKCVSLMPVATEPLWGVVLPLIAKEDWVNLEKTYLRIVKLDPKNYTANYRLGLIYYYRKNYITAKKYFDVILNSYPFDYDSLIMSAWTSYFLGNMKDAKVLFQKCLLNNPGDSSALEGLGLIK